MISKPAGKCVACGIEVLMKRAADVRGVGEDEFTTLRQNVRRLFFSFIIFTT